MKMNRLTNALAMFVTVIAVLFNIPGIETHAVTTNANLVENPNFVLPPGTVVSGDFLVRDGAGNPYEGDINKVQILDTTGKPFTYRVYVPEADPETVWYAKIPNSNGIVIYPCEMLATSLTEINFTFPKGTVLSGDIPLYYKDGSPYYGEWDKIEIFSKTEKDDIYQVWVSGTTDDNVVRLYAKITDAEGLVIHPGETFKPILEDADFKLSVGTVISGDIYLRDNAGCPYEGEVDKIQIVSATGKEYTYKVYVPGENGGVYLARISTGKGIMIHPGESLIIKGDINSDLILDAYDLVLAKRILTKEDTNEIKLAVADFNCDGNFSVADVMLLQKWLLGVI